MFCTLRKSKDSDEPYAFRMDDPPFSKTKGRFSVIACTNCRTSKLKCTGEPEGCQRCGSKNLFCQYQTVRRDSYNQEDEQSKPSSSGTQIASREEKVSGTQQPNHTGTETGTDFLDVDMHFDILTPSSAEKISDLLPSSREYTDVVDLATESPSFVPATDLNAGQWGSMVDIPNVLDAPSFPHHSQAAAAAATTSDAETATALAGTSRHHQQQQQTCMCFFEIANAYEAAAVNLFSAGGEEQPHDTLEILLQQKATMGDCEALLRCPHCVRQSAFVMLLITLCERLVASLDDISRTVPRLGERKARGGSSPAAALPSLSRPSSASTRHSWRRHDPLGFTASGAVQRRLDDEDQSIMVVSLCLRRSATLQLLIDSIQTLVRDQHWWPHALKVRQLQDRIEQINLRNKASHNNNARR